MAEGEATIAIASSHRPGRRRLSVSPSVQKEGGPSSSLTQSSCYPVSIAASCTACCRRCISLLSGSIHPNPHVVDRRGCTIIVQRRACLDGTGQDRIEWDRAEIQAQHSSHRMPPHATLAHEYTQHAAAPGLQQYRHAPAAPPPHVGQRERQQAQPPHQTASAMTGNSGSSSSSSAEQGIRVGNYIIREEIGKGSFATVYRGERMVSPPRVNCAADGLDQIMPMRARSGPPSCV